MSVRLNQHRHGWKALGGGEGVRGGVRSDWLRLTPEFSKPPKATCSWMLFTVLFPKAEHHLRLETVC